TSSWSFDFFPMLGPSQVLASLQRWVGVSRWPPISQRLGSVAGRLSQCSLHGRIECAKKPRPVPLRQQGWPASNSPQFPQVPRYFTTGKCVADIRSRPLFSGRGDDARPFLRQRDARGISEVTHTSTAETCSAIQSSVASALSPKNHAH